MESILLNFFHSLIRQKGLSRPESTGLRHIAFEVDNLNEVIKHLNTKNIFAEQIRIDDLTNKRFTFIFDPDNLPIELYEK